MTAKLQKTNKVDRIHQSEHIMNVTFDPVETNVTVFSEVGCSD